MTKKKILFLGIDPKLIDFNLSTATGWNANQVQAAAQDANKTLMDLEYEVQSCLVDLGETAESVVSDTLSKEKFDCIMVGAGIRILPQHCQNTSLVQNYTLQIILKIKAQEEIGNTRDVANDNSSVWGTGISKVYFMICHACLWCASCIVPHILGKTATVTTTKEDSTSLTKCPSCAKGTIASIPIAENQK